MRITITGVYVDDQEAAVAFYTDVLGFQVKHNVPVGEHAWITVVSPDAPDGPELLLEPAGHPAVKPYRDALVEDGIPLAQFAVDDVAAEYERLTARGVTFTQPPIDYENLVMAVFDDTCGNLIMIQSDSAAGE
ncbi:MAG: VOC family protein [Acidimicrobiales bacterium]